MTKEQREMIRRSRECERLFEKIEPVVWDYAERKHYNRDVFRAFDSRAELWEDYPDDWEPTVKAMLASGSVFTIPPRPAGFVRSAKSVLGDAEAGLARKWRSQPWSYLAFEVVKDSGESLLTVRRLDSDELIHLYSPAISSLFQEGFRRFIGLLWTNGLCYQMCGIPTPLLAFDDRDVCFFAESVEFGDLARRLSKKRAIDEADYGHGLSRLSEIVLRNPIEFLGLISFSSTPSTTFRGEALEYAVGWSGDAPAVDPDAVIDALATDEDTPVAIASDEAVEIRLSQALFPDEYVVTLTHDHTILNAFSVDRYREVAHALRDLVSLPSAPLRACSFGLYVAAHKIIGKPDPAALYAHAPAMDGDLDQGSDDVLDLDEADEVMRHIVQARNEGRQPDTAKLADELGIPTTVVEGLAAALQESLDRIDASFGEVDHLGLPPAAVHELTGGGIPAANGFLSLRDRNPKRPIPDDILATSPQFRLARYLLQTAADEGGIELTRAGYLKRRYLREIQDKRILPPRYSDETVARNPDLASYARPSREMDWLELAITRALTQEAGLILPEDGRLAPGPVAMLDEPEVLYRALLVTAMDTFDWGAFDRIGPTPIVAQTWGFLLYAARTLSGPSSDAAWVDTDVLIDTFYRAFPAAGPPDQKLAFMWPLTSAVHIRFVARFAAFLGLFEHYDSFEREGDDIVRDHRFRTAALFDAVFDYGET